MSMYSQTLVNPGIGSSNNTIFIRHGGFYPVHQYRGALYSGDATGLFVNRRERQGVEIKELDRVRLRGAVATVRGILPSGTSGTVVHRYRDGVAFEVEIISPSAALLTLRADEIARIND